MDIDCFRESPVGTLRYIEVPDILADETIAHYAFIPDPLPQTAPLSEQTYKAVTAAHMALGRLDSAVRRLPNPSLLVRPALRREAQSTSALEGTYATMEEILEADYIDAAKRSAEVQEVMNYVEAATRGLRLIETKPICLTLVAELQEVLVRGTRGDAYDAGQLRTRQVYIGDKESGIRNARFVPPPPGDDLIKGMSDWEKWINAEDNIPLVVKAALGHYQFETLHPFSDGNGRLGRLIVVLQLVREQALAYPIINLSPWFERRKDEYKNRLLQVSCSGEYDEWVEFFCGAVIDQANDMVMRIEELLFVREGMQAQLRAEKVRGVALDIIDDLIGYPVITASEAAKLHGVTWPPANRAIKRLEELGILVEATGKSYGRIYVCRQVMRIVSRA